MPSSKIEVKSIGSLFRGGIEYDRRGLCVKEKHVPATTSMVRPFQKDLGLTSSLDTSGKQPSTSPRRARVGTLITLLSRRRNSKDAGFKP
jgi:hypothetical protein